MTNLQATPGWDDVYQLEITDPAQGGAGGVMNRQAQALLNRAAYLNNQLQAVVQALTGKAPLVHQHDAGAITSGVLDPARIPVLPSQHTVTSSGDLNALTVDQQAEIVGGTIITTTDGWRWVYKGSGPKTDPGSYIQLADITPEWTAVGNKPTTFAPSPHTHEIADVAGLIAALGTPHPHTHTSADITDLLAFIENSVGGCAQVSGLYSQGAGAPIVHWRFADGSFASGYVNTTFWTVGNALSAALVLNGDASAFTAQRACVVRVEAVMSAGGASILVNGSGVGGPIVHLAAGQTLQVQVGTDETNEASGTITVSLVW